MRHSVSVSIQCDFQEKCDFASRINNCINLPAEMIRCTGERIFGFNSRYKKTNLLEPDEVVRNHGPKTSWSFDELPREAAGRWSGTRLTAF